MIDITNELLTNLEKEIQKTYPKIEVSEPFMSETTSFPCVTFGETNNSTDLDTSDSSGEFACNISFEVNIFTFGNRASSDCRKLKQIIDKYLVSNGLLRLSSNKVENYADTTIYRWVLRYSCIVDKEFNIYRR